MTLKSNPRIKYRLASQEDFIKYYGERPPYSAKAIIFFYDDFPVGIAGYKIDSGHYVIFSEIKENFRISKHSIFRCAKIVLDMIKDKGVTMFAQSDNDKLCKALGLEPMEDGVYVWLC